MSSRRSVRQLLVAVLLGVLVGGGLMAVTPAGAEVSNAVATNWKNIWKKNLKPLADKRYYTKAQSDAAFSTKAQTAAGDAAANAATDTKLGGYYKKAESDAKYAAAGSSYTKAESDAKYAGAPRVQRGIYNILATGNAANELVGSEISFGVTLADVPAYHIVPAGGPNPVGCSGTYNAPNASPGHLCVFQRYSNAETIAFSFPPTTFGALLYAKKNTAGSLEVSGSWALGVGGLAPAAALSSVQSSNAAPQR